MSNHPPPAPDWILGEDGHWRPPPFNTGSGPRPTPPAPGSGPDSGFGGSDRDGRGGGLGKGAVSGVIAFVLLVGGVGFKVADGIGIISDIRKGDTPAWEKALAEDEAEKEAEAAAFEDLERSMRAQARVVLGPEGDLVCPEVEWVGPMTDDLWPVPQEIVREGIEWSVNEVDISGIQCGYGDHIRMGKLHGFEERVDALMASGGPVAMREGPFPRSVRFDDPATLTATIVFEDEEGVLEAFVQLPIDHDSYLISLADLALN